MICFHRCGVRQQKMDWALMSWAALPMQDRESYLIKVCIFMPITFHLLFLVLFFQHQSYQCNYSELLLSKNV